MTFEDIAPYLDRPRHFDRHLLARIAIFVESIGYVPVEQWDNQYSNSGSSSGVTIRFSSDWHVVEASPSNEVTYTVTVLISARGPFVTSQGLKLGPTPADMYCPPGEDRGVSLPSEEADKKALQLATVIAQEFNLTYTDREWLRRFKLTHRSLTSDALLSLDFSEPNALNILFYEFV
jgi:hypothetical protein